MIERPRTPATDSRLGPSQSRMRVRGLLALLGTAAVLNIFSGHLFAQQSDSSPQAPSAITAPTAKSPSVSAGSDTPSVATGDNLILLIANLTGDGAPADRRRVATQILQLRSEDAVKALSGILSLNNNSATKVAICEALADTDDPPASLAEPLLGLLKSEKDQQIRDAALTSLARFNDASVSERLKDLLEQEELQWLRSENVTRSRELYALLPKDSDRVARLLTWLKAPQPLDRLTALEIVHSAMLATTPLPPAREVLQQIRQMLRDPDERVRRSLVVVLMDLQEKEDAARIMSMLEHERSPIVLEEIYKALGRMGDPEAITACIKGLKNAHLKVAGGAADALGRLCRKGNIAPAPIMAAAVSGLIERTSGTIEDASLRAQIIGAMSEIADPRFLPILIPHAGAGEPIPLIRQAALAGLGRIGDPQQAELVISQLTEDQDLGVRQAAAEALGRLGAKPEHLQPLMVCLSELSGAIQTTAWEAYRRIFSRLPWESRLKSLEYWLGNDKSIIARRIDLLSDLETQAAALKNEPDQLLDIREWLGDALMSNTDYALAAGAYTRAVESLSTTHADRRLSLTAKLMDAHLHAQSHDKASALVAAGHSPEMTNALAEKLLAYVHELAKLNGKAAADCIDLFKQSSPALFQADWKYKFETIRQAAAQTTTSGPST